MTTQNLPYPRWAKVIHLGLALFGITAFLTGELAEHDSSTGYLLHAYLGLSLAAVLLIRVAIGFTASEALSFKDWSPLSRSQWQLAQQDIRAMLKLQLPERDRHQGLAGLVQAFGLLIFSWMALTGTGLFILDGSKESTLFEQIAEVHEVGESLIPLYLALHIGAVILHTLSGNPIWKRMFTLKSG